MVRLTLCVFRDNIVIKPPFRRRTQLNPFQLVVSSFQTMNALSPSESTPKIKILIVEDSEVVSHVVAEVLHSAGYDVLEAADAFCGLSLIQTYAPDVILSDIEMPGMSGIEMAQELRKRGYTMPIIFASTIVENSTTAAEVAQITPFVLHKPFTMAALREIVRQALLQRSAA